MELSQDSEKQLAFKDVSNLLDTVEKVIHEHNNTDDEEEMTNTGINLHSGIEVETITDNKVNKTSLLQVCRICAVHGDFLIPIFGKEGLEHDLPVKIHKYLPIKVTEDDTLPLQLCYQCATTLLAWDEIRENCLEVQNELLKLKEEADNQIKDPGSEKEDKFIIMEENTLHNKDKPSKIISRANGTKSKSEEKIDEKFTKFFNSERCSTSETFLENNNDTNMSMKKKSRFVKNWTSGKFDCKSRLIQVFSELPKYTCNYCQFQFQEKSMLIYHILNHSRGESAGIERKEEEASEERVRKKKNERNFRNSKKRVKFYSCMYCDFNSKTKKILQLHLSGLHEELRKFSTIKRNNIEKKIIEEAKLEVNGKVYYHCNDCGKNLYSPYTFSWHKRIHTGERPFTCHLCGKQFRVNQGLTRHLRETHDRIKKFSCDICKRMFTSKRNVEDHRRIHTGERPYVCNVCGKAFKQKASLFVHNRTHSAFFPFKCSHCKQEFRSKSHMLVHITKHTGEKPFTCEICNRSFRIKFELKRHRVVHSDERPWQCNECDQLFKQKRYLVNHKKLNHEAGSTTV